MQNVKLIIGFLALILCGFILFLYFDFQNPSWEKNKSNYIVITSGFLTVLAAFISYYKNNPIIYIMRGIITILVLILIVISTKGQAPNQNEGGIEVTITQKNCN